MPGIILHEACARHGVVPWLQVAVQKGGVSNVGA